MPIRLVLKLVESDKEGPYKSENHAISAGSKTDAFGFGPWPGVSPLNRPIKNRLRASTTPRRKASYVVSTRVNSRDRRGTEPYSTTSTWRRRAISPAGPLGILEIERRPSALPLSKRGVIVIPQIDA